MARPTSWCGPMSGFSAPSISSTPARSCVPPSPPRPSSWMRSPRCWRGSACPGKVDTGFPIRTCAVQKESAYVAAMRVLERRIAQIDPGRRGEKADRDRLVLLQGHQEGVAIFGALAVRERDALDLESPSDQRLEGLLLLREAISRLHQEECGRDGECLVH